ALATRRAFSARLVLVELGDADAELHHAATVVDRHHAGRSHRRVQLQEGIEVVADVDLVGTQDHGRRAAGDDGLQGAPARNPSAEVVDQAAKARPVLDLEVAPVHDVTGDGHE